MNIKHYIQEDLIRPFYWIDQEGQVVYHLFLSSTLFNTENGINLIELRDRAQSTPIPSNMVLEYGTKCFNELDALNQARDWRAQHTVLGLVTEWYKKELAIV